ncbi:MAG: hypothetical protein B6U88_00540 [Candidatus Aenigmarchaeota archaeon ex4484_56]|nr:MAG: hypothetical protein B6U88_00540 [Candidatus Aenigmarchaeota archaeon ex4484_56]
MRKGISLPVNAVVVIALAIMVMLMLAGFLWSSTKNTSNVVLQNAWDKGCNILKSYNCDADMVSSIDTEIDVTNDNVPDTFLTVCQMRHGSNATKYTCRNKCCGTVITEGLNCTESRDCTSAVGGYDWYCSNNHCCPSDKTWNAAQNKCD